MAFEERGLQKIFKSPLFSGVQKEEVLRIFDACNCEVVSFQKGEILLSPQQSERKAGILLEGRATVTTPDDGRDTFLRYLSPNEPFGVANLFSDSPFVSRITAAGTCRVLFLPENAVGRLLESDSAFLYNYLGFLSGRIRFLNQKIRFFTAGSAERRLALYLASFGSSVVKSELSLSVLAELLGLGRASLYRAFDKLEADGLICKSGKKIFIPDPNKLRNQYENKKENESI